MPETSEAGILTGPVEIVGTGLIGTSIALACRRAGLEVLLTDTAPDHLRTATGQSRPRGRRPSRRARLNTDRAAHHSKVLTLV